MNVSKAQQRWAVHLALILTVIISLAFEFVLTFHIVFGLIFVAFVIVHLTQRRRTSGRLVRRLLDVKALNKTQGRLAMADLLLLVLTIGMLVSGSGTGRWVTRPGFVTTRWSALDSPSCCWFIPSRGGRGYARQKYVEEVRLRRGGIKKFGEESLDETLYFVSYETYLVDASARGVDEVPVQVALPGVDRAGVSAAHGDDDIGVESHLHGQFAGRFVRDVDALFPHHVDDRRIQVFARCRTRRVDSDAFSSQLPGERRGHLGSSGIVHAQKEDLGTVAHSATSTATAGP